MKKNLTQGITDFKEFIDNNCYFVDKTHLIAHIINDPSKVHLITRPRRFGKTLNLSMIRYFFEAPPPHGDSSDPPPNAALFNGMSISKHPKYREYMGKYPVIHLSFKDVKKSTYQNCMALIRNMLSAEYQRHEYLQNCGVLRDAEKELFSKILDKKGSDQDCEESITFLSIWLHRAYNKPVYILLDEYDTPLHAAYADNFYDEMIAFIRSFMVQSFKDNPNLKQAVVIGILKVAQESIFSDFNNPAVSTVLSNAMKDCFGFTEPEVEKMAAYFGQESRLDGIRQWYNGYLFGDDTVIYNPWSLVSYFRNIKDGLLPYWVHTSSNRMVKETLQLNKRDSRETMESLLKGEEVRREVAINIVYPQIRTRPDVAWSFLLHGGYLKADERQQVHTSITHRLSIPNLEVTVVYEKVIRDWLEEDMEAGESFHSFIRGIREGDATLIAEGLGEILLGLASFHDTASQGEKEEKKRAEGFYHGLVLGMLAYLSDEYTVESNRECGMGRPDIVLIQRGPGRPDQVLLFEFKRESATGTTPLKQLAQEAYTQAEQKYLKGAQEKWNPEKIIIYGVGFRGKALAMEAGGENEAPP
ncbi:MAG: AAA family ATPase [Candidatus Thiodiazotropha endolucinida]